LPGLRPLELVRPGAELPVNYLLFIPRGPMPERGWPAILYLHGKSLSGDDPSALTRYGPPRLVERDPAFPFVVIAPIWLQVKSFIESDLLLYFVV
jgi:predicted peptidase